MRSTSLRTVVWRTVLGLVAALVCGLSFSASAQAGSVTFCSVVLDPAHSCEGPRHSVTGVSAVPSGNQSVCAGAKVSPGGAFYGGYVCSSGGPACHPYAGANLLYPVIRPSATETSVSMYGIATWGSESCSGSMPSLLDSETPLERPQAYARAIASQLGGQALTDARRVETPLGDGWIVATDQGETCLVIPDTEGAGLACRENAQVSRDGLAIARVPIEGDNKVSFVVAVVPQDGETSVTADWEPVRVVDGVVSVDTIGKNAVRFVTGKRVSTMSVAPMTAR